MGISTEEKKGGTPEKETTKLSFLNNFLQETTLSHNSLSLSPDLLSFQDNLPKIR